MQTEIFMECKNDILAVVKSRILVFRIMAPCNLVGYANLSSLLMYWHSSYKANCSCSI